MPDTLSRPAAESKGKSSRGTKAELLKGKYKARNVEGKKFGIRVAAHIIDAVVYIAVNFAIQFLVGLERDTAFVPSGWGFSVGERSALFLNIVVGLVQFTFYFAIFEWLYGATFGKLVLGMRVVKKDGEPCDLGAAFIRALLLRFVDGLVFGIPAYVSMKAPLYQRIGDKAAKTIVVDAKETFRRPRAWWRFWAAMGLYLTSSTIVTLCMKAVATH